MRILTWATGGITMLVLSGCSESLYVTEPRRLANEDGYVPAIPYAAVVSNTINVAIVPAAPPKDNTTSQGPPTLTVSLMPVPVGRAYLYMTRNALFSNSFNVSAANDGMLSSSDTTSTQQVSAILAELAQTAAPFVAPVAPGVPAPPVVAAPPQPTDDSAYCAQGIAKLTASSAAYQSVDHVSNQSHSYTLKQISAAIKGVTKSINIALKVDIPEGLVSEQADVSREHPGFVVYAPVLMTVAITCSVNSGLPLLLSPPLALYGYFESSYADPKRDFLTGPAETFTLNEGFLTGHKYSDQSSVKTVVDTVTAPIRALLPSVSVQQSTQVQTGGGKPDQTTTTTQTTTGAPKTQ